MFTVADLPDVPPRPVHARIGDIDVEASYLSPCNPAEIRTSDIVVDCACHHTWIINLDLSTSASYMEGVRVFAMSLAKRSKEWHDEAWWWLPLRWLQVTGRAALVSKGLFTMPRSGSLDFSSYWPHGVSYPHLGLVEVVWQR